jgi:hypothetical protein
MHPKLILIEKNYIELNVNVAGNQTGLVILWSVVCSP